MMDAVIELYWVSYLTLMGGALFVGSIALRVIDKHRGYCSGNASMASKVVDQEAWYKRAGVLVSMIVLGMLIAPVLTRIDDLEGAALKMFIEVYHAVAAFGLVACAFKTKGLSMDLKGIGFNNPDHANVVVLCCGVSLVIMASFVLYFIAPGSDLIAFNFGFYAFYLPPVFGIFLFALTRSVVANEIKEDRKKVIEGFFSVQG